MIFGIMSVFSRICESGWLWRKYDSDDRINVVWPVEKQPISGGKMMVFVILMVC